MSILRPINQHGAYVPFESPAPCPVSDIDVAPRVSISFNETWIPVVMSALKVLTRPETYTGLLTDIQRVTRDAHSLLSTGGPMLPVGTIVPNLLASFPSNWLACDGNTYLRTAWPELYAAIHANFHIDADHFFVPNLRGRTLIVAGSGAGLTSRVIGQSGGEENHVLSVSELPAHHHLVTNFALSPIVVGSVNVGTVTGTTNTGDTGSGAGHNTMPPFGVIQFSIVASSA